MGDVVICSSDWANTQDDHVEMLRRALRGSLDLFGELFYVSIRPGMPYGSKGVPAGLTIDRARSFELLDGALMQVASQSAALSVDDVPPQSIACTPYLALQPYGVAAISITGGFSLDVKPRDGEGDLSCYWNRFELSTRFWKSFSSEAKLRDDNMGLLMEIFGGLARACGRRGIICPGREHIFAGPALYLYRPRRLFANHGDIKVAVYRAPALRQMWATLEEHVPPDVVFEELRSSGVPYSVIDDGTDNILVKMCNYFDDSKKALTPVIAGVVKAVDRFLTEKGVPRPWHDQVKGEKHESR